LREDPDVILVGEIRDGESMRTAIEVAETGHLVFSTLHTINAIQSLNRIIDFFPDYEKTQIRMQLSLVLQGIVSQRLLGDLMARVLYVHARY
jgi:twitching motility protein PilT